AVLAAEPAQTATEGVARDADVRRGSRQERLTACVRRAGDPLGHDPRLDAGGALTDLDLAHPLGLDQDRVVDRAQGDGPVTGPLPRHLEAVVAGDLDALDDVVGALD